MKLAMIGKIGAGAGLALAVLGFAVFRVDTTGSYERTFNASPDKVWRIWNEPGSIRQWWGPTFYTAPVIRNDARVGGTYLWSMKSPTGDVVWNTGTYREVVPNLRLVATMSFADASGHPIPGADVPVPGHWPDQILVTTAFTQAGGKTKVTVTEAGIPLIVALLSKIAWQQQFDKVESLL